MVDGNDSVVERSGDRMDWNRMDKEGNERVI
jgi:hypothetical protein